jgi:hypothetical protein
VPEHTDENEKRAGAVEVHPGIERFKSGVVGDYVKQQEDVEAWELENEREWEEKYAQGEIPEWMDEERITARAYEGEYEYELKPEEMEKAARESGIWQERDDEAEERVEAYQEEWKIGESTYSTREDDNEAEQQAVYRIKAW